MGSFCPETHDQNPLMIFDGRTRLRSTLGNKSSLDFEAHRDFEGGLATSEPFDAEQDIDSQITAGFGNFLLAHFPAHPAGAPLVCLWGGKHAVYCGIRLQKEKRTLRAIVATQLKVGAVPLIDA